MKVKLVSVTKPMIEGCESAEELIAYCARVSNPNNQNNHQTAPKLIKYLADHKHFSPFEMVNLCIEITTSRAVAAQILRHRSFSFQEFSQRYSEVTAMEPMELRSQADKNRQSSSEALNNKDLDARVTAHLETSQQLYLELMDEGVARECARGVLPLTTETTLYMNGTVRSWMHYCQLRCQADTQLEHRDIADGAKEILLSQFPTLSSLFS